ncbi:MAG: RluA family pseudouridine synthase [Myxococcales bacterium]
MSPRGRLSRKQRARAQAGAPPPDIAEVRTLSVGDEDGGERVDRLLAARLPDLSRARVQALIEQGLVRVDKKPLRSAARLAAGVQIEVRLPRAVPTALVPVELRLPVLYEDRYLLVIDKPAGIAVHPGAGVQRATVVHGLLHQLADLAGIGGELRPGIVHRLDKDTSGCLAVAKTEPALRGLQAAFKARTVEKRYRALVHGSPPEAGEFDTSYGRHPTDRKRFSSKVSEGRRAVTRYRVLGRGDGATLVDVALLTGRTHQIRAHFADAGFPLLGDRLYGGTRRELKLAPAAAARLAAERLGRQGLHAHHLAFAHPITGAPVSCTAPLPEEFRAALSVLGIDGG